MSASIPSVPLTRRRAWAEHPLTAAMDLSWVLWLIGSSGLLFIAELPTWIWLVPAVWLVVNVCVTWWIASTLEISLEPAWEDGSVERGTSLFRDAVGRLRRNRLAMLSSLLLLLVMTACFGQWSLFHGVPAWSGVERTEFSRDSFYALHIDHTRTNEGETFQPPSRFHWFGTDTLGRDLFARTLYGGSVSFLVGMIGTVVSVVVGVAWGAVAGYAGGRVEEFMMRIVDILYGLPFLFLVILIMTLVNGLGNVASSANQRMAEARALDEKGDHQGAELLRAEITPEERTASLVTYFVPPLVAVFVAIGLVSWLTMARITRGQVLSLKEREYVVAARAIGAGPLRIIFRHIVPNLLGPVIVYSTLTIPEIMLSEAFLSFVGLGISEPNCSWGSLASEGLAGVNMIKPYWWLMLYPATALSLSLFCLNFIGDGLRDALDPKGAS